MRVRIKFLLAVLALAVIVLVVNKFVCGIFRVSGTSMMPTLRHGDWCVVWKLGKQHLRRGDIIFFRTTDDPPLYFVKRVVALPGETISMRDGQVEIDGKPLEEPYTTPNKLWNLRPFKVPDDYYYFIGDNRARTMDNHVHGAVARRNIVGRVTAHWGF